MKRSLCLLIVSFALIAPFDLLAVDRSITPGEEVYLIRLALLVGSRASDTSPDTVGAFGSEDWIESLLAWDPESDNAEVMDVFALEGLGEVARQAGEVPRSGGEILGAFHHQGSWFEVSIDLQPASEAGQIDAVATLYHDGEELSRARVRNEVGRRSMISTTDGPAAPFLFLVFDVQERLAMADDGKDPLGWEGIPTSDPPQFQHPVAIEKPAPTYPESARREKIMGTVVVRTLIDKTGSVQRVDVVRGLPGGLSKAAIDAVRKWRFEPARLSGSPVAVAYHLVITFELQ